jgi:DNA-binding NarL/FixJ family response regulator
VAAPARQATVLVAVRSGQVREALAALIGSLDGFRVVGEAATHEQALAIARTSRPRVDVVDEELPGRDVGSTILALYEEGLAHAIVAIGTRADGTGRAHAAGACAYLQMGASPDDILHALTTAATAPSLVD